MLTCVTRSMNDELYEKMLFLCPSDWEFVKITNSSAAGYLDYIFHTKFDTKWVLNLDEDCFLTDYEKIYSLIQFMEQNDYDYCGVQDGGTIPVRIHNPLVCNPFFNLFNCDKIYNLDKDYYQKKYDMNEIKEKYSHLIRFNKGRIEYDLYEKFYYHFFWMLENNLKPYFLDATEFTQERYFVIAPILRIIPYYNNPTMLLSHDNSELGIHTWHSRYYNWPNIKKAIDNCFDYAKNAKNKMSKNVEVVDLRK